MFRTAVRLIFNALFMGAFLVFWGVGLADSVHKPKVMLLKVYQPGQAVVGWVMSEKLDGMRGIWNGHQLISRQGHVIHAPKWFVKDFPSFALDGELWTKRNDFAHDVSIIRQQVPDARWHEVSYHLFEVPYQAGGLRQRLAVAQAYFVKHPVPWVEVIPQITIHSNAQFKHYFKQILAQKGEGLVVRDPTTLYQTGRLSSALKVKPFEDDECIVRDILPGKGRFKGQMGALRCELVSAKWHGSKMIKIGSGFTHAERENPPKIGQQVTFKYYGLTQKGRPRFPIFMRVRPGFKVKF